MHVFNTTRWMPCLVLWFCKEWFYNSTQVVIHSLWSIPYVELLLIYYSIWILFFAFSLPSGQIRIFIFRLMGFPCVRHFKKWDLQNNYFVCTPEPVRKQNSDQGKGQSTRHCEDLQHQLLYLCSGNIWWVSCFCTSKPRCDHSCCWNYWLHDFSMKLKKTTSPLSMKL